MRVAGGLADVYSANIHDILPQQGNNNLSPFEIRNGWTLDPDTLLIHVFECPVQYEPHGGTLHKKEEEKQSGVMSWELSGQWP